MIITLRARRQRRTVLERIQLAWTKLTQALVMDGPHEWDLHPDVLARLDAEQKLRQS